MRLYPGDLTAAAMTMLLLVAVAFLCVAALLAVLVVAGLSDLPWSDIAPLAVIGGLFGLVGGSYTLLDDRSSR